MVNESRVERREGRKKKIREKGRGRVEEKKKRRRREEKKKGKYRKEAERQKTRSGQLHTHFSLHSQPLSLPLSPSVSVCFNTLSVSVYSI